MKRVFEYWAQIHKPGYEIIGARPNILHSLPYFRRRTGTGDVEPLKPLEPMLSIRGGASANLRYEATGVAVNEYPGLFLLFAQMPKTPNSVKNFADAFGLLGSTIEVILLPSIQTGFIVEETRENIQMAEEDKINIGEDQYLCVAEAVTTWYEAIDELHEAINVWNELKAGSKSAVDELQVKLNTKLENATVFTYLNASKSSLEILVSPRSLISALWLQFALAIDGRKAYKQCPTCQNWFEIGKWGSRADKTFCSNKCRQAAYDARKRELTANAFT